MESVSKYKDSHSLNKWVKVFLYASIASSVLNIILGYRVRSLAEEALKHDNDYSSDRVLVTISKLENLSAQYDLFSNIGAGIFIVTTILVMKWIYRANFNSHMLGAVGMKFTPGWAVGWCFIPIANLWKPYQVMKEIWKTSSNPSDWENQHVSGILPWWWFFWLVSSIIVSSFGRMIVRQSNVNDLASLMTYVEAIALIDFIYILPTIMLILIIKRISAMQNHCHAKQQTLSSNQYSSSDSFAGAISESCLQKGDPGICLPSNQTCLATNMSNQENLSLHTFEDDTFDEENAWEQAYTEFESEDRKNGLWAKAYSDFDGDEAKAKAYYLKIRAQQLINSHNRYVQKLQETEKKRRKEKEELLRYKSTKKIKKIGTREYAEFEDGVCEIETRWGEVKRFPNAEALKKYVGCS